ncbi:MAG: hypothetical protein GF313_12425 [Caldithrix sp.]|nr:hypothetical protein [Caldithrix sp.]
MIANLRIDVCAYPQTDYDVLGRTVILIDVLRASTTIISALSQGIRSVIPVATLGAARRLKRDNPGYLLAGERNGNPPDDFDFGNSPLAFKKQDIDHKELILTTTNGTHILQKVINAAHIYVGAFINLDAVIIRAAEQGLPISLICAGNNGEFSAEDALCAAAMLLGLNTKYDALQLTDQAQWMLYALRGITNAYSELQDQSIESFMKQTEHGHHLSQLGYTMDISFASRINHSTVVPDFVKGKLIK